MFPNVGTADRVVRALIGAAMILLAVFGKVSARVRWTGQGPDPHVPALLDVDYKPKCRPAQCEHREQANRNPAGEHPASADGHGNLGNGIGCQREPFRPAIAQLTLG